MSINGKSKNGRPDVQPSIEFVTPEKAAKWLKRNVHNRTLNRHRVRQMANDLLAGRWLITSGGVGFAKNGALIDGQTRCHAVVAAGVGAWMLVVRGLEPTAQEVIDTGQARTLGQTLSLRGEKNANLLAAALRAVYAYRAYGDPTSSLLSEVSKQQLLEVLEANPDIRDSLPAAKRLQTGGIPGGLLTGLHYLFSGVSADLTTHFFEELAAGENLTRRDPVWHLRNLFQKQSKAAPDRRVGARLIGIATIKAFNAYALGREIRQLKSDRREDVPTIVLADDLELVAA